MTPLTDSRLAELERIAREAFGAPGGSRINDFRHAFNPAVALQLIEELRRLRELAVSQSQPVLPSNGQPEAEPSGACQTCGGLRRVHVVEGCAAPAHDIDCPTCIGREIAPGIRVFSVIPR